jgi:Uroporphyrinogen-III decarboxylase
MASSRERLHQTLNHIEPEEVVVDMGATAVSGINANALKRLKDILGMEDKKIFVHEALQLLGEVDEDVRQRLQLDCVDVGSQSTIFGFSTKGKKPWTMQSGLEVEVPEEFNTTVDEAGRTYIYPQGDMSVPPSGMMPKDGFFFDNITRGSIEFDEDTTGAKEDFGKDYGIISDESLAELEEKCNDYYNNTEYGLVYSGNLAAIGDFALIPGPNVKEPKGIRDLPDFMMAHSLCPDYVHEVLEMHVEAGIENAKRIFEACGNKIQVMCVSGTDFGTQNGPFMSLDAFREFYKPRYQRINDWIHENTTWKTFFHSCGAITNYLQDFHECGIDILNPVQLSAKGMDGKELKEKWGDKFVFWGGGIDTQRTLPFGTPEEVYNEVTERLNLFAPGGGFVFNTVHNIQSQTSAENLKAMFDAINDYKRVNSK